MLTRMFFWYFGHPLVYFWIMGAYIIWYNIIPTRYAGNVFSDGLARLTFVMLILLSTPVGIHHEFMEPGISSTWKMLHTVLTYGVAIPSFITAFAIFASFELAAIKQGRRGFTATVKSLPWDDPPFSGRGIGNAVVYPWRIRPFSQRLVQHGHRRPQYDLDRRHFHVTVGGPVALTFLGAAYWMIPRLTGRARCGSRNGRFQTRLWFFGMLIMSLSMHFAGLLGAPRRTADVGYLGANVANSWEPLMLLAAAGGFFLFVSILTFVAVAIGTLLQNAKTESMQATFATPAESAATTPPMPQHVFRWGVLALVLAVLAYAGPLGEFLRHPGYLAPGMRTW
jgi:cytochrome c oxidase subunit 1